MIIPFFFTSPLMRLPSSSITTFENLRFTRLMVWIRVCFCNGLSLKSIFRLGTSKPVIHISTTITMWKLLLSSLNNRSRFLRCCLSPKRSYMALGSFWSRVATTLTNGTASIVRSSSSVYLLSSRALTACPHSGLSLIMVL